MYPWSADCATIVPSCLSIHHDPIPSSMEETTSMEESSELESSIAESSAEESSKPAASSSKAPAPSSVAPTPPTSSQAPTGGTDERMDSRAFYDALVPKATAMGYKCEWLGEVRYASGQIGYSGNFTLPSGFWVKVEYMNDKNRNGIPVIACYLSTGGPPSTASGSYEDCFNRATGVLNANKSK